MTDNDTYLPSARIREPQPPSVDSPFAQHLNSLDRWLSTVLIVLNIGAAIAVLFFGLLMLVTCNFERHALLYAVVCGAGMVLAVGVAALSPRMLRLPVIAAGMMIALGGIIVIDSVASPSHDRLKAQGDRIIVQLEQFKGDHGHDPRLDELRPAGIELPNTWYGPWEYRVDDSDTGFCLSIGDYAQDLFVLYRCADMPDWYLDS